jgi:hypothetical protein
VLIEPKLIEGDADVVDPKLNPELVEFVVGAEPKLKFGLAAAVAGTELKLIPELVVWVDVCPN